MNRRQHEHEDETDFSARERQVLHAWQVPEMPADLAAQVLARVSVRKPYSTRRIWAWTAVAASIVILVALADRAYNPIADSGYQRFTQRTTLHIGTRAVAVAEAGAELTWRVSKNGTTELTQAGGNIFYRVEPGEGFSVKTSVGNVAVIGTCFRIEVREENVMKSKHAGMIGAAAGAAIGTIAIVTVYEGKVMSSSLDTAEQLAVSAGQVAQLSRKKGPRVVGDVADAPALHVAPRYDQSESGAAPGLAQQHMELQRKNQALVTQVAQLQQQLQDSSKSEKRRILNPTPEELAAMAQRCELRWDLPSHGSDAPKFNPKDHEKLGFTEDEVTAINDVLASDHVGFRSQVRKIYIETTGNVAAADALSPDAMITEVQDKAPQDELRAIYQMLARERAGLQPRPATLSGRSATERLMRLITSAGDNLEKKLGQQIGPDLARRYRELHDGFGSRSTSSYGCPGQ